MFDRIREGVVEGFRINAGACICLRVRGFLKQDYGIQLKRKLAQIEHLV